MSMQEIAGLLGVPEGNRQKRLSHARGSSRELYGDGRREPAPR
jgi:DNA-directed RNA polymerase specialized sigma24 family protein